MTLFRTFKTAKVNGCSVVDGEIHEQIFAERMNEYGWR